jgi:ABC-type xylose transport system substrate-binding protein
VIPHENVVAALVAAGCLGEEEALQMEKWADARPQASMDVLLAAASDDPVGALVALVE